MCVRLELNAGPSDGESVYCNDVYIAGDAEL